MNNTQKNSRDKHEKQTRETFAWHESAVKVLVYFFPLMIVIQNVLVFWDTNRRIFSLMASKECAYFALQYSLQKLWDSLKVTWKLRKVFLLKDYSYKVSSIVDLVNHTNNLDSRLDF